MYVCLMFWFILLLRNDDLNIWIINILSIIYGDKSKLISLYIICRKLMLIMCPRAHRSKNPKNK